MKIDEFIRVVDELDFDKKQYCIIASDVMLMYGLRDEVNDVDLRVTPELFQQLLEKYQMKQSSRLDYVYELSNKVDVNCKGFNYNDIVIINGYPVEKLEKQLEWKLVNNRAKDKEDIQRIQDYLKEHKK